jgi:arylsulfatase A-like enzyme
MLDEHGFVEKWGYMYDPVIHTPLLIKMPGNEFAGSCKTSLVESVDLLPIVLDILSLPTPEQVQGKSLLPYIRGESTQHKARVFAQYYCGSLQNRPALMVRDKEWKLTSYPEGHQLEEFLPQDHPLKMSDFFNGEEVLGELYDLNNDPEERTNLFHPPDYSEIKQRYLSELDVWLAGLGPICNTDTNVIPNLYGSYVHLQGENANRIKESLQGKGKLFQLSKG